MDLGLVFIDAETFQTQNRTIRTHPLVLDGAGFLLFRFLLLPTFIAVLRRKTARGRLLLFGYMPLCPFGFSLVSYL